ncbi:helix-turn-helix transcriptional regulator [Actinomadura macra]|uniref:helix-turn-helix transcriptional regulator n=1 Tax=Actinomadura macra TaxID=46164 RepID=UPI00082EF867|nr:hypothetical protein [Actinomadura macra]
MNDARVSGRRFYGIAEIAEVLGVDRQLVTVWRRRSSHGIPAPDDELASGPLWLAATIEPWIERTRARLEDEAAVQAAGSLTPGLVKQAARRLFRLVVLLLEEERRPEQMQRALHGLGQLHDPLAQAIGSLEGSKRSLQDLATLAGMAAEATERTVGTRPSLQTDDLLAACLQVVPQVTKLLARLDRA